MYSMSQERAMMIDNIMLQALKQSENGDAYPTVKLPGGSSENLHNNISIGKILESNGYGRVIGGTTFIISVDGFDFIKWGGFTRMLKEEEIEEERKEIQHKLNKKYLRAAKREPIFRWLAAIFGSTSLIQLLMQLF